jgi:glutaconate CoA-transferase subunit B
MDFDPDTLRIRLKSVHPGVTIDWVKENVMFDLIVQGQVPTTPEPTAFELRKLRALDRRRIYLGKGEK